MKLKNLFIIALLALSCNASDYFVGSSFGLSTLKSTQTDHSGSITLGTPIDEDGYNVALQCGILSKNDMQYLKYNYVKYDDMKMHNYTLNYDYIFKNDTGYNPYIGTAIGVSFIELTSPHLSTITDKDGREMLIGLRAGIQKNIANNTAIFAEYNYELVSHETSFSSGSASSTVERNNFNNLNIGLRYSF